jgi:hypothetical protein
MRRRIGRTVDFLRREHRGRLVENQQLGAPVRAFNSSTRCC